MGTSWNVDWRLSAPVLGVETSLRQDNYACSLVAWREKSTNNKVKNDKDPEQIREKQPENNAQVFDATHTVQAKHSTLKPCSRYCFFNWRFGRVAAHPYDRPMVENGISHPVQCSITRIAG